MLNIRPGSPDGRYTLVIQLTKKTPRRSLHAVPPAAGGIRSPETQGGRRQPAQDARRISGMSTPFWRNSGRRSRITPSSNGRKTFTVHDILLRLTAGDRQPLRAHLFQHQIAELIKEGSQGTANKYNATLVAFEKFAGSRRVHFDDIDEEPVAGFRTYLHQIPLQPNTVSFYLSNFGRCITKPRNAGM